MFKAISLGWGVQSFTLAAMVAVGELEPVQAAIHADTMHEGELTYDFARCWTAWLEERGVKVVTVKNESNPVSYSKVVDIPAFTHNGRKPGQTRRNCTQDWKIAPLRRWLQANRNGQPVEQWLGISMDEFQRMRDSDVKYVVNRWPLIEKRMSRNDCISWLQSHGIEVPPKSSCTFCPYHNQAAWREIKMRGGADWEEAVTVDRAIRKVRPPYDLYVHPARIPLEDVDLRNMQDRGQLSLWDEECSGLCGV